MTWDSLQTHVIVGQKRQVLRRPGQAVAGQTEQGPKGSGWCADRRPTGHLRCTGTTARGTQAVSGRAGHWPAPFRGLFVPFGTGPLGPETQLSLSSHFACCSLTFGRRQNEPGPALSPLRHIVSSLSAFPLSRPCVHTGGCC